MQNGRLLSGRSCGYLGPIIVRRFILLCGNLFCLLFFGLGHHHELDREVEDGLSFEPRETFESELASQILHKHVGCCKSESERVFSVFLVGFLEHIWLLLHVFISCKCTVDLVKAVFLDAAASISHSCFQENGFVALQNRHCDYNAATDITKLDSVTDELEQDELVNVPPCQ